MTESTIERTEMTEPEGAPATGGGRGRPRPDATIQRDEQVLSFLRANGAKTRADIAAGTQIKGNEVYLSLYRLSRADPPAVVREGNAWKVPEPALTEA